MPAIQTTYGTTIAPAFEGMVANSIDHIIVSKQVETAAGVGYGKVVVQGTGDDQVRVSEASRAFVGITEATHDFLTDAYPQYSTAAVVAQGEIWVVTSVAVVAGDLAYYVPATGVITNVPTSNTAIPNGRFTSSAGIAGLAKLRFG